MCSLINNLTPWAYKGKAIYGGVGDNFKSNSSQNNPINMIDFISKRNALYNDINNNKKPIPYNSVDIINKKTANDYLYSMNNYINGHPYNIKLTPYPTNSYKMDPDIHYDEGRNPTLLKAVKDRYINVAGTYTKIDNKDRQIHKSNRHTVSTNTFK